jgi:hypothetical protein
MSPLPFLKQKRTIDEVEEETEELEAQNREAEQELSLAQKKVAIAKLKERGLTPSHFSFDWRKIRDWLKTH